jgi:hypothetical protein
MRVAALHYRDGVCFMTNDSVKNKRLIGIFLLGCLFFNYPLLSLFSSERTLLGIPFLYLFIFSVWSVMIVLLIAATHRSNPAGRPSTKMF